jgi:hypothetical protein
MTLLPFGARAQREVHRGTRAVPGMRLQSRRRSMQSNDGVRRWLCKGLLHGKSRGCANFGCWECTGSWTGRWKMPTVCAYAGCCSCDRAPPLVRQWHATRGAQSAARLWPMLIGSVWSIAARSCSHFRACSLTCQLESEPGLKSTTSTGMSSCPYTRASRPS